MIVVEIQRNIVPSYFVKIHDCCRNGKIPLFLTLERKPDLLNASLSETRQWFKPLGDLHGKTVASLSKIRAV